MVIAYDMHPLTLWLMRRAALIDALRHRLHGYLPLGRLGDADAVLEAADGDAVFAAILCHVASDIGIQLLDA